VKNKNRYFLAELIGSCFLVMIIVGSGLMAENLTNDTAVMLIANTLATGAGLFVLITVFADVSGAHFNPFVSIAMTITGKLKKKLLPFYIFAQVLGCLIGVGLANFFFEHQIFELSTIFGSMKSGKITVAASVGLYITAGYWFTSSTSFANPAVAIARTFTESFTGISYLNTPFYIFAELIGMLIAVFIAKKLFLEKY
jgi:glycerol uptake facilitator-like aquaporin